MLFANRSAGLSPLILAFVWAWNATGDEPAATQPPWHLERGIVLFANPHGGKKPARILTITPEGSLLDSIATIEEGTLLPGRISPDGKKLAFTREQRPNGKPGVWIMGADRKPVLMTDDGWVVAWSPDGSRLALFRLSADEPPKCESLLLDVKTKQFHRLPIPQTDLVMDWSPDGRDLLVTAGNPDRHFDHPTKGRYPLRHIYRVRVDGTERVPLAAQPLTDNSYPRYSPDGGLVVYQCRRHEGEKVLYTARVVDREGKAPNEIINFYHEFSVRPNGPPAWSPDGRETVWACVRQSMDGRIEDFPLVFVSPDGWRKRLVKTESLNAVIFPDWR